MNVWGCNAIIRSFVLNFSFAQLFWASLKVHLSLPPTVLRLVNGETSRREFLWGSASRFGKPGRISFSAPAFRSKPRSWALPTFGAQKCVYPRACSFLSPSLPFSLANTGPLSSRLSSPRLRKAPHVEVKRHEWWITPFTRQAFHLSCECPTTVWGLARYLECVFTWVFFLSFFRSSIVHAENRRKKA